MVLTFFYELLTTILYRLNDIKKEKVSEPDINLENTGKNLVF